MPRIGSWSGLAVLSLLAEAAAPRPLVCLVDDAQWLDDASAQVLGFVARRLLAESVLLLFAVREAADERLFPALPTLTLEGLADDDARALLTAAVPGHLDAKVRDRLVAETRGHPLALLELARGISDAELAGGFAVPATGPLSAHLHDHYLRRVRALPEPTQRLMLLAAADPTGDATLLWRAGRTLGLGRRDAAAAASQQLVEIGARVRFRHPLVRSAAYAAAPPQDRRAAHRALAEATDTHADPERRMWHQAAAATEPDEAVATALEQAAVRTQARAGLAAAAAFLQRSVTPDRRAGTARRPSPGRSARVPARRRVRHRARPAGAGRSPTRSTISSGPAWSNSEDRSSGHPSPGARRRFCCGRPPRDSNHSMSGSPGRPTCTPGWHPPSPVRSPGPAAFCSRFPGRHKRPHGRREAPRPCDLLLDGLTTMVTHGRATAEPTLRRAVDAFLDDQVSGDEWLQWGILAQMAAMAVWDFDSWITLSTRHVELARASGALAPLSIALNGRGMVATQCGDFETATSLAAEKDVINEVTGIRLAATCDLLLAGYRGRPVEAMPLFSATTEDAIARGEGLAVQMADWATAVLHNGLGRYTEALRVAEPAAEEDVPAPEHAVGSARTDRGRREDRTGGTCAGIAGAAVGDDDHRGFRLGEGPGGALASAAERRARCGAVLRRGGRAARPHPAAARARPGPPAVRRVAAPRGPAGRRAPPAARRLRPVRRDGRRGLHRARTPRAAGHGREGPQARGRHPHRAHSAGGAHRSVGPRRTHQSGDRRGAVPQHPHRRMAPPQGFRQVGHRLPKGPRSRVGQSRSPRDTGRASRTT